MTFAIGYDVSDYQANIPSDAQFVFIKATEGGRTNQQGYAAKLADARGRGLVVGHYHFLHAENPIEGEIDHFCQVVGTVPAGELLVLDFEPYGQPVADAAATAVKNAWLTAIKQRYPNNRVGLYTSVDWWHRTDDNAADFLWIADYVAAGSPRVQAAWRFHQWTDNPLDCDMYNGTIDDLRAWAGASAPAPVAPHAAPWPGLQLVTRDQWGAKPWKEPNGSIPYAGPRLGVKIHYLGSPYTFGDHAGCSAYVRKVQAEHMDSNGWSDIGYSLCVCEHGVVFEGRGLTRRNSANGDVPLNEAHYAVCAFLGSSGSTEPTPEQLQGLRDAIEYCQQHGPAGPEIKGHKDGYQTDCPGSPLYAWVQAGAPRPNTTPEDIVTPQDIQAITDAVAARLASDPAIRDANAFAVHWWLQAALAGQVPTGANGGWSALLPQVRSSLGAVLREEGSSTQVRDANAFAVGWWLQKALTGTPVPEATGQAWGGLLPQLTAALSTLPPAALTALQTAVQQAIATATVHVQVDVTGTPAVAPKAVTS
ncbi:GH25 family lysozyme [Kitasatospora sp. NPDC094028]